MLGVGIPFVAVQAVPGNSINHQMAASGNKGNFSKFGEVFSKIANNQTAKMENSETIGQEVQSLLNADSIEEVFELLGIPYDEGLLMISRDEEDKMLSIDELLSNFDDILSLLNLNLQQLNEMLQTLTGSEVSVQNVWDFIQYVNEDPNMAENIIANVNGDGKGTPNGAVQFIKLLKLLQVIGEKSDLILEQPERISNLKSLLQAVENTISKEVTSTSGKTSLEGFQQVVKQVETKVETSSPFPNGASNHTAETRTITITLPNTNQASQAESLVKQIEALIQRSQLSTVQGTTKLLLKLYPENLGSIRIELIQRDGVMSARLLTSTSIGKELLDSQIHQLKQAFVQQNIQLERIEIYQSLQETDLKDHFFNNMFNGKQQSDEDEKGSKDEQDEESVSFKDFLINEEV
jgi:flagellar hook-length control protein FliK